jgi:hypothetical protein
MTAAKACLLVPSFIAVVIASSAARLGAQERTRVLPPGQTPSDSRLKAAVTLDSYHPFTPPADLASWRLRAERVRRQVRVAAGLWPEPPAAPLNAVVHGKIDRGDYTVERVFFQSYPGFYVTGSLYRPVGRCEGRRPAVLSPHGHWQNGRFYERGEKEALEQIAAGKEAALPGARYPLQARCAQLARMGCVVFHYDMVGNADSKQIGHAAGFGDLEAELRLQSAFGLQTYNSLRALDFLAGLPDVDPERIGVTGASGGGTQTFILCALDERPAAAFPAVMVSTAMQGGCVCENASHLRVGTGNVELAALAAPRPYAMTGANDWTLEIEAKGLPELKALWRLYGAEDWVAAWCFPTFEHNYNQVSRELMYDWFNRHLGLGLPSPVVEQPFEPVPPAELSVFDDEHPRPSDAVDAAGLRRWLTETSDRQMAELLPVDPDSFDRFRRVVGGALEVLLHTHLPSAEEVEAREVAVADAPQEAKMHKLLLGRKASGEEVPAVLVRPRSWNGVVVIVANPRGKEHALFGSGGEVIRGPSEILPDGAALLAIDAFLTGEFIADPASKEDPAARLPVDRERHRRFAGYSFAYNRTLLAQRVHDILTAIAYAGGLPEARAVHLIGTEEAGGWAALARALAGGAVAKAWVDYPGDFIGLWGFDDPRFLPGALKYGDMPTFLALSAPHDLVVVVVAQRLDLTRSVYRACGAEEKLSIRMTGHR